MTKNPPLTPEEAKALFQNLSRMTKGEKLEALQLLDGKEDYIHKNQAKTDMIEFAKAVYPGFKVGPHHRKLAKIFSEVIRGEKNESSSTSRHVWVNLSSVPTYSPLSF